MTTPVYSFDVFDTCLVRSYAAGVDLLADAARRVVPPGEDHDVVVGEVVRLRMEGEARARRDGRDAAPLDEVYAELPELARLGVDPGHMCRVEMELERATLRPVAPTAARIAALRAQGARVLFISDMHLPAWFLRRSLEEHGLALPGDPVYVSGDLGLAKGTGRLYEHVLAQEGLEPHQLVHRGDDEWTDLASAVARGVQVDPFPEGRLNRYERAVVTSAGTTPALRSRAAAVSRAVRLQEPAQTAADRLAAGLGADVVGPVLAGFASWLLADARRRGLARLCFSSGSGPVLLELAQLLRGPDDPACSALDTPSVRRGGGPGLAGAAPDDLLPAYAAQEDLREGVRWALVDLGWSLDTLAALRAALGPAAPELGYALAVAHVRHPLEATGPFVAQVREDVPWGRKVLDGGWLLDAVELVEHLFVSADQGACLGYERRDGRVLPVLGPARPAPAWSAALRRAVLAYARAAREAGLLDDGGAAASAAGLEAGRSFVLHPTREEALLFGATPVPDDPAEAVVRAIAPPLGVEDLVRRVQRRLGRRPDAPERPGHWSAASWAAAPPHVRIAVGVAQRAVPVVRRARGVVRRGVGRARASRGSR